MKGLKIIPMFLILIILSYFGIGFIEANREQVVINFGNYQSHPTTLGFTVLTSVLAGMLIAGLLCSIELLALTIQNRRLKNKLKDKRADPRDSESPAVLVHSREI